MCLDKKLVLLPEWQKVLWWRSCRSSVKVLDSLYATSLPMLRCSSILIQRYSSDFRSMKSQKTAALSFTHRETEACAATWKKAIWQTSERARQEPTQVIWTMSKPAHQVASPSWLSKAPSERVNLSVMKCWLLYSSHRGKEVFSSFQGAMETEKERRTIN